MDLSKRYGEVVAIDNTAEMLDKTRETLRRNDVTDARLFHGELADYQGETDLIAANMVLHHLASPARFFHQAHQYLTASGSLLIADLCAHDEGWTKETCGDLWLGFEPEELDGWALASGLTPGQSAYLGLNNGFQVQVRLFHKH